MGCALSTPSADEHFEEGTSSAKQPTERSVKNVEEKAAEPEVPQKDGLPVVEPVPEKEGLTHSWDKLNPCELAAVQHTLLKVNIEWDC